MPPAIRLIVAMTGASGAIYGIRALQLLRSQAVETHLIVSPAAGRTIAQETGWGLREVEALAAYVHSPEDVGAAIASGSFITQGMLVAPCSIKTLSAVANSYTVNLIVRAADVCLKEGRPLVLMVRETPLHLGHLRLMATAAEMGAVIFPPVPAFYSGEQTLDEVVAASVGRALARMGIENDAYPKWEG
ncbi:MAG: UbiX family flavin prenyltransferase [Chloroflexota bacterium]